jgi:conjugative relaxase-like TrwC/TraI family protein
LNDVTISAPKSLSVMAVTMADERLIAAHEKAVAATMEAAERLASARVRKGAAVDTQESRVTGNIVCVQFLHRESRALDPQLHTHCITFNVTHDPVENRFKALEARPLYDNARELTAIYREHLTQSLHALGYETYRDRFQCVQIRGVDAAIMRQFSKRSAQRDAWVQLKEQQLGRSLNNDEVAQVVRDHRARKQKGINAEVLRNAQLQQLSEESRLKLAQVKQRALDVCAGVQPRREAPQPQPYVPGPWIATIRLAMLATRSVNADPYLFSPNRSFEDRVLWTVSHLQQVQRAKAIMRQMQRGQRGISR